MASFSIISLFQVSIGFNIIMLKKHDIGPFKIFNLEVTLTINS